LEHGGIGIDEKIVRHIDYNLYIFVLCLGAELAGYFSGNKPDIEHGLFQRYILELVFRPEEQFVEHGVYFIGIRFDELQVLHNVIRRHGSNIGYHDIEKVTDGTDGTSHIVGNNGEQFVLLSVDVGQFAVEPEYRFVLLSEGDMSIDPGEQFPAPKWLHNIVHTAYFVSAEDIVLLGLGCQKNHGNMVQFGVLPDLPADFKAGHFRHHDIEQDKVRSFFQCVGQCLVPLVGKHEIVERIQDRCYKLKILVLVVDHQY